MAVREFAALGFDPAPGDAAAIVLEVMDFLAGWSSPHMTID